MKANNLPKVAEISDGGFLIYDDGNTTKRVFIQEITEFFKDKFSGGGVLSPVKN